MLETIAITRITLREIHLPLRETFRISSGMTSTRRILLLELTDRDGVATWSECTAGERPNYSPETIDTAWLAIGEWVAPRVLGREFGGPQEIHAALERDFRGHNMAKAAVEMGGWALAAERRAVSLTATLGGTRAKIATGISLGIQPDPESLARVAREARAEGYRKIKCKIAPGADLEYLAAAREALGPDAPLMADANSAYTLDDADHLARLDELDLLMIEQPLANDDLVRHAELQKRLKTPICLDESITGVDRAEDMLALGAGKIINIKPARVGGFTSAKAIHDLCAARGVPVWHGGMLESGIGRAYNVALASLANFTIPGDVSPSARYWEQDIVTPEWTMSEDGMVSVPYDRPGLGIAVNMDRIDELTVRRARLVAE
ncbi:MAG: o-succinylbenzoate synthase [Gemmatimonadota bacterium]|nr:MAG: o-succinylbenzoate synthase [Gemmatimonadota bacterium]